MKFMHFNCGRKNEQVNYHCSYIRNLSSCEKKACTGIAEVIGSNPVQAKIFFRLSYRNSLSCENNCDDHSLVQNVYLSVSLMLSISRLY